MLFHEEMAADLGEGVWGWLSARILGPTNFLTKWHSIIYPFLKCRLFWME